MSRLKCKSHLALCTNFAFIYGSLSIDFEIKPIILTCSSFQTSDQSPKPNEGLLYGKLIMFNTIEEFKEADKKKLIFAEQERVWNLVKTSSLDDLTDLDKLMARFVLLTFVDVKKYKVVYWFSFPAFDFPKSSTLSASPVRITTAFNTAQLDALRELYYSTPSINKAYFIVTLDDGHLQLHSILDYEKLSNESGGRTLYVAFADPSTDASHPGWPLRNLIAFLYVKYRCSTLNVIAIRIRSNCIDESLLFEINLAHDQPFDDGFVPDSVGFERNESKKLLPKSVDLSSNMDPKKLIETAVDLNLKLMRWRLMPSLKLETIGQTKCLLLGSGTLGCNVARSLLGWGIKHITFVDNGKVSYSNPVRQSLFEYTDSLAPAKNKCDAAAEALKRINPNVNSSSVNLSIPMPGHFVSDEILEKTKQDIRLLEQLIDAHDCIFLLMDTRESRWLPTLICHSKQKLVINAALGFDTYLVQRHGYTADDGNDIKFDLNQNRIDGSKLGCYYCNDVVAPGDSTKNRTLDQQCTVTRPGVSMIAAALAVELMVSVLQHPDGQNAPAYIRKERDDDLNDEDDDLLLGIIPHQIRGFLSQFSQVLPTCLSYKHCTACSESIVNLYRNEGLDFLINVFNDCSYLEDVSGLKQIHEETDLNEVWELDSE